MSNGAVKYGPTFGQEVTEAGLSGKPFEWTPYVLTRFPELAPADSTQLDAVVAAHDPTKQVVPPLTAELFISRWTNAEYLALEKKRAADITANKVGNAKNWDQVCGGASIDLNKQKTQSLKADLVTDGILTQARADVIFAP